jgi:3'-5' exoribonuclease
MGQDRVQVMTLPDDIAHLTIADLKRLAKDGAPHPATVHAQIEKVTKKTTKGGKPFVDWMLRDVADFMPIKVWDNHPNFVLAGTLEAGAFISVTGHWTSGKFGLESQDWKLRELASEEIATLLAAGEQFANRQQEDYAYILAQVAKLKDPRLRTLATAFLELFGERFKRTAAAREYHHARRGGLVEHVAQMMRSADALCAVYTEVNRDLVLTGVLFHDCGKLWENCLPENGFAMPYSELGELIGHIPLGMEVVNRLWREAEERNGESWAAGQPAAAEVRMHLLHLIASHHGEHAFGSPTVPKTPEAQLLHYVDNIDAKMEMFRGAYLKATELGPNVFERVRPLPANLVRPLQAFDATGDAIDTDPGDTEADPQSLPQPPLKQNPETRS